jgi:phosphomevalonate kinase
MSATAPGKLILTGEYAVLDGAPALVVAVDRRVSARRRIGPHGSSPFLVAVAEEIARAYGVDAPEARAAMEIVVDSSTFFLGNTKLGLGSSAAVTVAATALALTITREVPVIDREAVQAIASAAHGSAQSSRPRPSSADLSRPRTRAMSYSDLSAQVLTAATSGVHTGGGEPPSAKARGSGADIAAAVHGGVIQFETGNVTRLSWPTGLVLVPFFTGAAADTAELVTRVMAAREANRVAVEAALAAVAKASRAACQACASKTPEIAANALLAALGLAAIATDQLASATALPLVPACVTAARQAMAKLGGTAKTTGAGGGDVAIAVIPATRTTKEDVTKAERLLIEAGCQPLGLSVDTTGVDLQPDAQ